MLWLVGCSGGAVVFAPTALPPDISPLRYQHPSGAFSMVVPRTWSVYEQNTTTLASASFTAPGDDEPLLAVAVAKLGRPIDPQGFGELINEYQTKVRPDMDRYKEENRQAMGDGSWRLTGLRSVVGGGTQQINTFIQSKEDLFAVTDTIVPADVGRATELQAIINTLVLNSDAPLEATALSSMSYASRFNLDILHVSTWVTPAGVFFITGEVANLGLTPVANVPVRAVLSTADGRGVAEAVDTVMGYSLPPGGFAPFSLRFGQGQPALTTSYTLMLGSADWNPSPPETVYGSDQLTWTDQSTFTPQGALAIHGTVTNTSAQVVGSPRAVVTVFNSQQNVIAAGFVDVAEQLGAGETASFQLVVPEIGGIPANYIVNVQGKQ